MAVIVVGGHSRSVGKTGVAAGIIAALPEFHWTAAKITQHGHLACSVDGGPCDCASEDHSWAITEERDRGGESDSSRFLVSGAVRSLWVHTREGMLAEAMPRLHQELAGAENAILESNSVLGFLHPDLYLMVLDAANPDFKTSAKEYLDRADAVIVRNSTGQFDGAEMSLKWVSEKPIFRIAPPPYVTPELIEFVRARLPRPAGGETASAG